MARRLMLIEIAMPARVESDAQLEAWLDEWVRGAFPSQLWGERIE